MKSAAEANILFLHANAALEQQFEKIPVRIQTSGERFLGGVIGPVT